MGSLVIVWWMTMALWAIGFFLWPRLRRTCADCGPASPVALSVVIPARNEERNLPALLGSLAAQETKPKEVLVVDDGSTDRTAEIARGFGATVLRSQPLPDGWRGKTWACHQGAQAATGELLLFLDADTWFEPRGLDRVLATGQGRSTIPAASPPSAGADGAFSTGPFHAVQKLHEQLSLFFNLNMTVGTTPTGLFGQMLLVDRQSYTRAGGHEGVKGRTLENVHLAGQFRAAGVSTRSVSGRGAFAFRMYPNGLGELIEGWTKGFASGAGQTPRGILLVVIAWMTGLMLAPIGGLITGGAFLWNFAYLLCAAQVWLFSRQIGAFRGSTALLYPGPLVFFFIVFARSAMRSGKSVTWKGREIRAD